MVNILLSRVYFTVVQDQTVHDLPGSDSPGSGGPGSDVIPFGKAHVRLPIGRQ